MADGNHIPLNWQRIKMFLKIIREVQITEGTLLLANWKAARTSQDVTDFDPLACHFPHKPKIGASAN